MSLADLYIEAEKFRLTLRPWSVEKKNDVMRDLKTMGGEKENQGEREKQGSGLQ